MNTSELPLQHAERLSALADGELLQEEVGTLLQICKQSPAADDRWRMYHSIGEVLRAPGRPVQLTGPGFVARLNQQLAKEPSFRSGFQTLTLTSIAAFTAAPLSDAICMPVLTTVANKRREAASNDGHFRWKMVSGLACAAAVFAITWSLGDSMLPAAGPQLAQLGTLAGGTAPVQVVIASPQGPMVRDARLEELLAAHKQLGATSAWPVPSGFFRNATFETQPDLGR